MKLLTIENFKELQPFMKQTGYREYNSNVMTMLMWSCRYPAYFAVYPHYALVYNQMPHRAPIWLMPFCKEEYREEAVEKIKQLSEQEQIAFEIHSMVQEFKNWLQTAYPQQFLVWDCYDARDYLYDRTQQETLAGKKMQKRRNHFHAFENNYAQRYLYKPLEEEDIVHVYEFLEYWKQQKDEDESIDAEECGIHFLLDHLHELPIQGGCIYIDGKLEAFTITSFITSDTVQIHVEKANKHIRGLYIAILKLFLETLPPAIQYVNREDDMGLAYLRKAKTDMHPVMKIKKYGCCYQPLSLHKAEHEDEVAIQQLWKQSFAEESDASADYYFQHLFQLSDTMVLKAETLLLSMAQARRIPVKINDQIVEVPFLVGVATNPEYHGCGYMKMVVEQLMKQETYVFLQAYDWNIYRSLGFREVYRLARTKLKKEAYTQPSGVLLPCRDAELLWSLYQDYTASLNGYRVRDKQYYEERIPYYTLWDSHYYLYMDHGKPCGYLRMQDEGTSCVVQEFICKGENVQHGVLSLLAQKEQDVYIYTDLALELQGRRKELTHMMVYYGKDAVPLDTETIFMNEEI